MTMVLHQHADVQGMQMVAWHNWSDRLRALMMAAFKRARQARHTRTLRRCEIRWCAIRGQATWYHPKPVDIREGGGRDPVAALAGHMQNTEAGRRADERDARNASLRMARLDEDRVQHQVSELLSTQPRTLMEGLERIPDRLPEEEQRLMATEVAAAFGVYHESTVAKTRERLWATRHQAMMVPNAESTHESALPQGPDWRTVAQWALAELLEVPVVNIELPLAELDQQLEDVMEEECDVER